MSKIKDTVCRQVTRGIFSPIFYPVYPRILLFFCFSLCSFVAIPLYADNFSAIELAIGQGDYKEAMRLCNEHLAGDGAKEAKVYLARALWWDQEQKKAIEVFLEALSLPAASKVAVALSVEEQRIYDDALQIYLSAGAGGAQTAADTLIKKYASVLKMHPEYHHLGFLIALAYANRGEFDLFFPLFYRSYSADPDHYLVHKTKAILYIKLYEKEPAGSEREALRNKLLESVKFASMLCSNDHTLYKVFLAFSKEEDRGQALIEVLKKMSLENIIPPRTDIAFYIQQAVDLGEKELAQSFLDRAYKWYPASRILDGAQQYINKSNR